MLQAERNHQAVIGNSAKQAGRQAGRFSKQTRTKYRLNPQKQTILSLSTHKHTNIERDSVIIMQKLEPAKFGSIQFCAAKFRRGRK